MSASQRATQAKTQAKRRKAAALAYRAADQRLRKAHPDEHDQYLTEEYTKRGLRRRTDTAQREQDKARAQLAELHRQYPDLVHELAASTPTSYGEARA